MQLRRNEPFYFGVCVWARQGACLEFPDACSNLSTFFNSEIFIISGSLSLRFVYLCLSMKLNPSTKHGLQFVYSHHFWLSVYWAQNRELMTDPCLRIHYSLGPRCCHLQNILSDNKWHAWTHSSLHILSHRGCSRLTACDALFLKIGNLALVTCNANNLGP